MVYLHLSFIFFVYYRKNQCLCLDFCQQYNAKLFYLESNQEDACRLIGGLDYEPPEYVQCTLQKP